MEVKLHPLLTSELEGDKQLTLLFCEKIAMLLLGQTARSKNY
jgi:hypothetical protein